MTKAREIARPNLKVSQKRIKTWYDHQKAWKQSFNAGDEVLILFCTRSTTTSQV